MNEQADVCLVGGRLFDGKVRVDSTALAVRDGRIIAIGDDARILELAGADTVVVDAAGGGIMPGFVDAHAHAVFAGVERLSCELSSAGTVEETLALVAEAAGVQAEGWVTGGGWDHTLFPHPTAELLDAIVPDRPVALSDNGHHTLWVNSAALAAAGIDDDTPDPHNGHIHRDVEGHATGYLNETAAELVGRVIPPTSLQDMHRGLLEAQDVLWTLGITGWHEAILGEYNGKADASGAYRSALVDGSLESLVSGALWIPPGLTLGEVPGLVEDFARRRQVNASVGFDTRTAKAMIDGVPHGATAALLDPYCDHEGTGELHFPVEVIEAFVLQLDAAGFALHLHVMGDRGIRVALDALETARRTNGPGPRHHIAHLSMVADEDAARFGPLGVAANMQALWAAPDPHVVPMIGENRMRSGYPFRRIADSGAELAMGSDWPVSPADPWLAVHVAVNRSLPGVPDALDPTQSLSLVEVLAAYTAGSSELVLGVSGRLRIGERADVTVTDRDPFQVEVGELASIRTVYTLVGGRLVHARDDAVATGDSVR